MQFCNYETPLWDSSPPFENRGAVCLRDPQRIKVGRRLLDNVIFPVKKAVLLRLDLLQNRNTRNFRGHSVAGIIFVRAPFVSLIPHEARAIRWCQTCRQFLIRPNLQTSGSPRAPVVVLAQCVCDSVANEPAQRMHSRHGPIRRTPTQTERSQQLRSGRGEIAKIRPATIVLPDDGDQRPTYIT